MRPGGLPTQDPAYQGGVNFLLRTQFPDGSWWVASRSWPFQPHFDTGFPYGKDQWISAAATAWAALALLEEIQPKSAPESFPTAQALVAKHAQPVSQPKSAVPDAAFKPDSTFARVILPLFQQSCLDCHSGEKPKGNLSLETVTGLLKGGQSGNPAIEPGQPGSSQLLRYVSDQFEDLEMPPLAKRSKFPALTREQVTTLRDWIAAGAN